MQTQKLVELIKEFPIAFGACAVALLVGVYLFFTSDALPNLRNQLMDLEREVATLQFNDREGATLERDLVRIKEQFEAVENRLFDPRQIATNNGFFYTFGQDHPVQVMEVSQGNVISQHARPQPNQLWTLSHFSVVPMELRLQGLLTDLMDFLHVLERSGPFINVRNFNVQRSTQMEAGYMNMQLTVLVLGKPTN